MIAPLTDLVGETGETRGYREPSRAILTTEYLYLAAAYHFFFVELDLRKSAKNQRQPNVLHFSSHNGKISGLKSRPCDLQIPSCTGSHATSLRHALEKTSLQDVSASRVFAAHPLGRSEHHNAIFTIPRNRHFRHAAAFGHQDRCARPPSAASLQRRHR